MRIQSWWRMLKPYHAFRALKRAQRELKALYYRALRLYWKSERLYRVRDVNSYNLYSTLISFVFCVLISRLTFIVGSNIWQIFHRVARRSSHFEETEVFDHSVFQNLHSAVASDTPSLHGVLQCELR